MLAQNARTWFEIAEEEGVEKGIEKGIEKGRREGRREGEARVLERQLTVKFGRLPKDLRQRLHRASERQLLAWSERFVTADSLEAVFGEGS